MKLSEKQQLFAINLAILIQWLYTQGYSVTFGEVKRTDEQAEINAIGPKGRRVLARLVRPVFPELADKILNNAGSGIRNSLHEISLAADLNLFKDGRYLAGNEDHRFVGEQWEQMHPDNRWGGHFGDGNHYSMTHEGRK